MKKLLSILFVLLALVSKAQINALPVISEDRFGTVNPNNAPLIFIHDRTGYTGGIWKLMPNDRRTPESATVRKHPNGLRYRKVNVQGSTLDDWPMTNNFGRIGLGVKANFPLDIVGDVNSTTAYRLGSDKFVEADPNGIYHHIYGQENVRKISLGNVGTPSTTFYNNWIYFQNQAGTALMASLYSSRLDLGNPEGAIYPNTRLRLHNAGTEVGLQFSLGTNDSTRILMRDTAGVFQMKYAENTVLGVSRTGNIIEMRLGGNATDTSTAISLWGYDSTAAAAYEQAQILSTRSSESGDEYGNMELRVNMDGDLAALIKLDGQRGMVDFPFLHGVKITPISATQKSGITPVRGQLIYCEDCVPTDASTPNNTTTGGVFQVWNGSGWKNLW